MARKDHPRLDDAAVRAAVDRLAARYREISGATPESRADAFRVLLFEEQGFAVVDRQEDARWLHVDTVLQAKRGYCLSLGVVALAVAERAGAPLRGVALPNHFVVRYEEGGFLRDRELTRAGATAGEAGTFQEESAYGRALPAEGVRACLLHNRGFVALRAGRLEDAEADFREAIRLLPGLGEAHRNLGVLLGQRKRWDEAKRCFVRALALHPRDVDALLNLALTRHARGEFDAALQDLEMALALEPRHGRARDLLDEWREEGRRGVHAPAAGAMPEAPEGLAPGLDARFFRGEAFDREVAARVDRELDFDWRNDAPAEGVPRDGFSVRWTGWFKAPRAGRYLVFLACNDGGRVTLAGRAVVENWRDMGYENFYGSETVDLEAGWHSIVVEHFDARGGARLLLRIAVDGDEKPLPLKDHLFHRARE